MKSSRRILLVAAVLFLITFALSDSPPSNSIPIVADRPNFNEINLSLFCLLSWNYFDVLQVGGHSAVEVYNKLIASADETGIFVCIAPNPVAKWAGWPKDRVARLSYNSFSDTTAYGRPEWYGEVVNGTTFLKDTVIAYLSAPEFEDSLEAEIQVMNTYFGDVDQVWFYNCFDEAPSRQWRRMVHDSIWTGSDSVAAYIDDYIPNMFTQDRGQDSLPTLEEVDPEGTFSWLKHEIEEGDSEHTLVSVFGLFHSIDWCYAEVEYGTFTDQVNSIESYLNMEYQGYGSPSMPILVQNRPEFFIWDCYPIRQVGTAWLASHSYDNQVSGAEDILLLEHFEEGMDSTFIAVRQVALDQEREIPAYYYPQIIGKCGGDVMWNSDSSEVSYGSYSYRIPTPQEFLMNCNIALMRGAVGIFPYCLRTYRNIGANGDSVYTSGLVDNNNLPFDIPYEEWVYTHRWRIDYNIIPPDSFPPFSDSCRLCDDFDPLWDLPARPDTISGSQRTTENYMVWKFAAYGRLWNSMRATLGEIATIALEITTLHWWEGYAECLEITSPNGRVEPQVRLFNDGSDNGYAFYVNRNCYDAWIPVKIALYPGTTPSGIAFDSEILDHSRRFLIDMETDFDYDYRFFRDTLDPGQSRLVQFFGGGLPADIRITEPDISASEGGAPNTKDYSFSAETVVSVNATFYNMGTVAASDVIVHLTDLADEVILDSDTISFSGLSSAGYVCDDQDVTFRWRTDSEDIGIHILEIEAEAIINEPDTDDNSTTVVFQITPRDYAKTVLDNPWNMTEVTGPGAPAWHTNDVISVSGWSSTFSDSISGMFEGSIINPSLSNRLELNLGSDSTEYIDTSLYDQFRMIAKASGPLTVTVHWRYEGGRESSLELDTGIGTEWGEIGPFDLTDESSGWASENVIRLWLEFNSGNVEKQVRIGWIKLTE